RWLQLRAAGRRGMALPFAVTLDNLFAGHVMVGNVVREPLLSAYVGYWIDSTVAGGGAITAAVALTVDHCFSRVGLHRLEATVRPENAASLRVLEKLGFREEGLFRRYLDVDGAWRDHACYALTADEMRPGGLVGRLVATGRAERVRGGDT
ncbi:MAG: GNAT family N-acetyltransferase, partial [Pseudonocardia sp.]